MKNIILLSMVFVLSLMSTNLLAQQTKKLSMQGFLKDANGKAVDDGIQEITFKLYSVASGGTAEWEETQTLNIIGGVYSTHLGSLANPLDNLNWGTSSYYVGVTVQGAELNPRTELTFAPYSLGSPSAQEVVCSGAVGDVKYSILNPAQFASVNGDCWVPMDGRSIIGSELGGITGLSNVTDAGGLFLRGQESDIAGGPNHDPERTSATAIASFQDQAYLNHYHSASLTLNGSTNTAGEHTHGYERTSDFIDSNVAGGTNGNPNATEFVKETGFAGNHSHSLNGTANGNTDNSGGNETRPKNLNLWTYIRIN